MSELTGPDYFRLATILLATLGVGASAVIVVSFSRRWPESGPGMGRLLAFHVFAIALSWVLLATSAAGGRLDSLGTSEWTWQLPQSLAGVLLGDIALALIVLHLLGRGRSVKNLGAADRRRQTTYEHSVEDTLGRLEAAGEKAAIASAKVAGDLANSQRRAGDIDGEPGEAADEASRPEKKMLIEIEIEGGESNRG